MSHYAQLSEDYWGRFGALGASSLLIELLFLGLQKALHNGTTPISKTSKHTILPLKLPR
jgi:hypothetical protein